MYEVHATYLITISLRFSPFTEGRPQNFQELLLSCVLVKQNSPVSHSWWWFSELRSKIRVKTVTNRAADWSLKRFGWRVQMTCPNIWCQYPVSNRVVILGSTNTTHSAVMYLSHVIYVALFPGWYYRYCHMLHDRITVPSCVEFLFWPSRSPLQGFLRTLWQDLVVTLSPRKRANSVASG